MEGAEVAEEKGVGGEVSRLIRLWKSVENSNALLSMMGKDGSGRHLRVPRNCIEGAVVECKI